MRRLVMSSAMISDAKGALSVTVPALRERAVFVIALPGGVAAVAQTDVPDLASYRRVALQWAHQTGFELHAHEFGANYGAAGHVWNGSPVGAGMGTLIQLGQKGSPKPRFSEVYTISSTAAHTVGLVSLGIETAVSPETCGRDIEVQVLTLTKEADLAARDIVLSMPGCKAVGDFLVLNNLVDVLKIAAR